MRAKQQILDEALALADEHGLGAISMRAVARRMGLTSMALYPYVGTKDDLLDGLVGRLLADLLPAQDTATAGWRERLRAVARAARALASAHPGAYPLLMARPSAAPDALRVVDLIYAALLDAGVPEPEVPRLERMLSTFVLGYATSEVNGRFAAGRSGAEAAPAPHALPAHDRLSRWLGGEVDWDAEFEADLRDLIHLVESAAKDRSHARGPRGNV
ncbi:TetR/AcrR family transcriptional regulator [Phytohabitans sp. ZYX-F-186]|uniref:TetR/AcrR family transcriptional regulator n=1 Tax=Phytohabitans maris TaxID=3071409 RepID=A0ABU0Z7Z1_9ACTN|nr:TetR/AcrR family transcriptional regulator [Phytohabitans sp. ZYX-F-186]MDQ7903163.1 TetR/AcrR family transcriptional regulator [Phytohabitans sp. ZYX-F-186]